MNMVGLPPGMIITLSGETSTLKRLCKIGGDRLAQRRNAGRRRVAVVAVAQRLDRRLDDEIGRAEIGLADAEIDDVAALRDKRVGAGEHREGIFLADAVESRDGFQHGVTPRQRLRDPAYLRAVHPIGTGKIKSARTCRSVLAAVVGAEVALKAGSGCSDRDRRRDSRRHCRRARPETGSSRGIWNSRQTRRREPPHVSYACAPWRRRPDAAAARTKARAMADTISLTGSDAMDAPFSSCRRSLPYPTGAAAQGRR